MTRRLDWLALLARVVEIVRSYDTQVTLRQLFYRLVAAELLPNENNAYKALSKNTANARRLGTFPPLMDRGRVIHRPNAFGGVTEAQRFLANLY